MNYETEIKALINLLDDPDEQIYVQIRNKIMDMGPDVIPQLENVWEKESLGILFQSRIEELIHHIQFNQVKKDIRDWRVNHSDDLLKGMYLICKYQYPDLEFESIEKSIAKLAQDIWIELNNGLTAFEKVRILNHILYEMHGFQGNKSSYHAPQNSFLSDVLESKKGNPISLSILNILLGERLNIPLYGINLPRHFIVAYVDDYFPGQLPSERQVLFYLNPFSKGTAFAKSEINGFLKQIQVEPEEKYFRPCSNIEIMIRVCNNLIGAYTQQGYREKVEEIQILQNVISSEFGQSS